MSIRDDRQVEWANIYMNSTGKGILDICPRAGKIRTSILVFQNWKNPKILISYPDRSIKDSWEKDFVRWGYSNPNVVFTTHLSLHKHIGKYDIVVIDEIHALSDAQILALQSIEAINSRVLGLTGTLSSWTERDLDKKLGMKVLAKYPMDLAVKEGIVSDYRITIKMVPLDDKVKNKYKSSIRTEKEQFDAYGAVIDRLEKIGAATFYLRLARMRIIQNSLAKIKATKELLKKFSKERILTFCGLIKTAENLGCPVFHSKSTDQAVFNDFTSGKGNHLAVVKIGNHGITYMSLNKVIINYFDSNSENLTQKINRCMAMDYSNPNKMADIWIITSSEEVELKWLSKALEFFDKSKIKFI